MAAALLLALQVTGVAASTCADAELASLARAEALLSRGDDEAAAGAVATAPAAPCALAELFGLALRGWAEARALAPAGGAAELQHPVRRTLDALQSFKGTPIALEAEYAEVAIRAAIAAAQDERPEMELLLTHARDLAERLTGRGRRAVVPRSLQVLAGELWFEVDRFEAARAAFDAAIRIEPSAAAYVGLARAQARLGQRDAACTTYRQAQDVAPRLRTQAARELASCR